MDFQISQRQRLAMMVVSCSPFYLGVPSLCPFACHISSSSSISPVPFIYISHSLFFHYLPLSLCHTHTPSLPPFRSMFKKKKNLCHYLPFLCLSVLQSQFSLVNHDAAFLILSLPSLTSWCLFIYFLSLSLPLCVLLQLGLFGKSSGVRWCHVWRMKAATC